MFFTDKSGYPNPHQSRPFWRDVIAWSSSVTPRVTPRILVIGLYAAMVVAVHQSLPWQPLAVSHVQYTGAVLVLLMVLRTNASYDRWWEGRRLWGGIVNQCRSVGLRLRVAIDDVEEQQTLLRWVAAFPVACMQTLRERPSESALTPLLGPEGAQTVAGDLHPPSFVVEELLRRIRQRRSADGLTDADYLFIDVELGHLINHMGGCERILRTPLPLVHRVKLRRFIVMYLAAFPFVVVGNGMSLVPFMTMIVAYPLLAIDQMAQELESPFSTASLSHLPLESICATIERTVVQRVDRAKE